MRERRFDEKGEVGERSRKECEERKRIRNGVSREKWERGREIEQKGEREGGRKV